MNESLPQTRHARLRAALGRLSPLALAVIGVIVLSGVGAGGYWAYTVYDYVEHDNDFCLSCHLMEDPYERFAQSAHRELGCKSCHRPTPTQRSSMAITQILENPDSLGVHAEVPNAVCAECHIQGDPERWASIASSAGHRIHLESNDPALDGLRCVECHSTAVHEFAPVDRTCAQSGCHDESLIQLGAMSELTIHCVACHAFQAPTPGAVGTEAFAEALSPDRDTCLSCHEMRLLVSLPEPDPHEGSCASCHDPHTQATPAEAAQSCASGACHDDVDDITPFHVGVDDAVMADCMYCHQAHDFSIDGANCLACHQNVLDDDPAALPRGQARAPAGAADASPRPTSGVGRRAGLDGATAARALHLDAGGFVSWNAAQPLQIVQGFRHSEHAGFACTACHESAARHGEVTVTTVQDCRSCHHTEPTAADCAACHEESGSTGDPYRVTRTLDLTVSEPSARTLPFDHAVHAAQPCATCHTEGLEMSAAGVDCVSCHEQHHDPETSCRSCHAQPPTSAHPIERAHVGCAGAGCHTEGPFTEPPRTRSVCLGCHQDMVDHRPEEPNCAECHALPPPSGG